MTDHMTEFAFVFGLALGTVFGVLLALIFFGMYLVDTCLVKAL